ncbi:MAG: DJ-1/PfpI family protein [Odoribacter sp.]
MKKSFLFLADGFEEMEAIAVIDVLRRGGVEIQTVSITSQREVKSAHGVTVLADCVFGEVSEEDVECLIFPGGMPGAQNLGHCKELMLLLQRQYDKGGYIAAICAAPAFVLSQLDVEKKLKLTCFPGFEKFLPNAKVVSDGVVVDGQIITGKGPGFAVAFGLNILGKLRSSVVATEVAKGMLL